MTKEIPKLNLNEINIAIENNSRQCKGNVELSNAYLKIAEVFKQNVAQYEAAEAQYPVKQPAFYIPLVWIKNIIDLSKIGYILNKKASSTLCLNINIETQAVHEADQFNFNLLDDKIKLLDDKSCDKVIKNIESYPGTTVAQCLIQQFYNEYEYYYNYTNSHF